MSKTTTSTTDIATYQFPSASAAWAFMHACQDAKVQPGYPSVDGRHTVMVAIKTWMDRETADRLANGAPCVAYNFAGMAA